MHPKNYYKGKIVCVTGAGGSIGSEICRRLVEYGVLKLILVGHSEKSLYDIHRELAPTGTDLEVALGSVTDRHFAERVTIGTDIVIHAAAHKHVPICEENPVEAVVNNVGGTMAMADAAVRNEVPQFIYVSTDKAVNPKGVMGATKRAAELYLRRCAGRTLFTTVRFGNVLNSSGSVLPLWREQLRQGKPITLTDRRCTRYFMSIPEAVDLTLGAGTLASGLYVLDMGEPRSIGKMAEELLAETVEFPRTGDIIEIGLRPGEKLTEELAYGGAWFKTAIDKVLRVVEQGARRPTLNEFNDLMMAARCRHRELTLDALWRVVK